MPKVPVRLTEKEIDLIRRGRENADLITDYFWKPPDQEKGWIFDYRFDPEGAWQRKTHHASQKRIVIIGGFGSGKTRGVGISAATWCMTVPDFAFLNAAPLSWQSELMYDFLIKESRGCRIEDLMWRKVKRPYPLIEFRFYINNTLIVSTMEFMSISDNATQILSWEGDWVNIDEAGKIDSLAETLRNMGSRLRGHVRGRQRLGRMSLISNSWDNPELWMRYDLARELPNDYFSFTVATRHNGNVTEDQLKFMIADIPEDEREQFLEGMRPEGRGKFFSVNSIKEAEDKEYSKFIQDRIENKVDGFDMRTTYGAGVSYFTTPRAEGHEYFITADPGTDNAPDRNSPVVMVWDVTNFPKFKMSLAAFWWGNGNGSITPFVRQLLKFMVTYDPAFTGVDSTGPQKNTNEILNLYLSGGRTDDTNQRMEWLGDIAVNKITNPIISGMDFSSGKKTAQLIAGRLYLEAGLISWPDMVHGIRSQLSNYDPDKDKSSSTAKLTQDIVATLCMGCHAVRIYFAYDPTQEDARDSDEDAQSLDRESARSQRLPSAARNERAMVR
jgi:hypothetical protein